MKINVVVTDLNTIDFSAKDACGLLFQYPDTDGAIRDYHELIDKCHESGVSDPSIGQTAGESYN